MTGYKLLIRLLLTQGEEQLAILDRLEHTLEDYSELYEVLSEYFEIVDPEIIADELEELFELKERVQNEVS